jgi:hypothetical protein
VIEVFSFILLIYYHFTVSDKVDLAFNTIPGVSGWTGLQQAPARAFKTAIFMPALFMYIRDLLH